jgi:hypothetical protein
MLTNVIHIITAIIGYLNSSEKRICQGLVNCNSGRRSVVIWALNSFMDLVQATISTAHFRCPKHRDNTERERIGDWVYCQPRSEAAWTISTRLTSHNRSPVPYNLLQEKRNNSLTFVISSYLWKFATHTLLYLLPKIPILSLKQEYEKILLIYIVNNVANIQISSWWKL